MRLWSLCPLLAASGAALATAAYAQAPAGDVVSYPPSFFAATRPSTAMDMINRIPGLTFNKGDDVRGFGGAAGNVLIDGQRPTSKSVALDQLIQRIPADQVERIDLIRGGAPNIDMQGQPVVANVVRKAGANSSTVTQFMIKPYKDGYLGAVPRLEETWRKGALSAEGVVGGKYDYHPDSGAGMIDRKSGGGAPLERGAFLSDVKIADTYANGVASWKGTSRSLRLNAGVERIDTDRRETGAPANQSGQVFSEHTLTKLRNDKAEVGADFKSPLTSLADLQAIALHTMKRDAQRSRNFGRTAEQLSYELGQTRETILRTVVTSDILPGVRLESGGEAAVNTLDSRSSLSRGGVAVSVPAAAVQVQEQRGEVFANASGAAGASAHWETGVNYEASRISQEGTGTGKSLGFLKPRAVLAWNPNKATQLRLRIERGVGQLNFKDFAATAELEAGTVNAGNPDIEPERSWLVEVALDRSFWGRGAVSVSASWAAVEKVVDLIPVGGQFDAPGNIGDGARQELKVSLTAPTDKVGLKDVLIQFQGTWRWSQVTDPVTLQSRRLSGQRPFEGTATITKSFNTLNSTLSLEAQLGYRETFYRISEIRTFQEDPMLKVYWDWTRSPNLIFRFQVENFTAKDRTRFRTLYSGPRSLGVVAQQETRNAEQAPFMMMRVRRTF